MRVVGVVAGLLVFTLGCMSGEPAAPEAPTGATLTSVPAGAVVFRDGAKVGTTPMTLAADALPATLELRADTFAPATVTLSGDQQVTLTPGVAQLLGYEGRFVADPLLTPEEVAWIPPKELPLVRNEVAAR